MMVAANSLSTDHPAQSFSLFLSVSGPKPAYRPLPFAFVRPRQLNICVARLGYLNSSWSNLFPFGDAAHPAPETLARLGKSVVPLAARKVPPQAVRIERRSMPAPANRLYGIMPASRLEYAGRLPRSVRPPAHGSQQERKLVRGRWFLGSALQHGPRQFPRCVLAQPFDRGGNADTRPAGSREDSAGDFCFIDSHNGHIGT